MMVVGCWYALPQVYIQYITSLFVQMENETLVFFVFATHKVITMKKILYVLGQRISGEKHGSHAS